MIKPLNINNLIFRIIKIFLYSLIIAIITGGLNNGAK